MWSVHSVGTTYKRTTSKIIRPLHEHQDTNLHDKLKLLSLQISDEPHLLLNTDSADFTDLRAQSEASV